MEFNNIDENVRRAEKTIIKERRKYERNQEISRCFRVVVFTPLSISFKVISVIARLVGSISSIGMPYGLYCFYRAWISYKNGIEISEIQSVFYVWLFIVLPLAAFLIYFLSDKLYYYFFRNSI